MVSLITSSMGLNAEKRALQYTTVDCESGIQYLVDEDESYDYNSSISRVKVNFRRSDPWITWEKAS